jgi:hypothetical protein
MSLVGAKRCYGSIAPGRDVGNTRLGLYELRRAFRELFKLKEGVPEKVEDAICRIVIFISEATRLQGA